MGFLETDQIGKNFAVKIDEDRLKQLNRLAESLGIDAENYSKTDLFDEVLKTASKRREPSEADKRALTEIQNQLTEKNNQLTELKNKLTETITQLTDANEAYAFQKKQAFELVSKLAESETDLKNAGVGYQNLGTEYKTLKEEYNQLTETLNQLTANNQELYQAKESLRLTDNQLIVNLNGFEKMVFLKYVENKEVRKLCELLNQKGKYNGLIDCLTGNAKTDIGIFLKNFFFNYVLQGQYFPEIANARVLIKLFTSYKKEAAK